MYNKYKISKFNLFFLSLLFTLSFILPALATDNSLDGELLLAASSRRIANPISMGRFSLASVPAYSGKTVAFARFGCYWIDSHSIITVNEEIG